MPLEDELLDMLGDVVVEVEEIKKEEEAIEEDSIVIESKEIEAEKVEDKEIIEEEVKKDDTLSREDILTARVEELQAKLEEKNAPIVEEDIIKVDDKPALDFMKDLDIDEVLREGASFNEILVAVYNKVKEDATQAAAEKMMSDLPRIVTSYIGQQTTMQAIINDFYEANPDLKAVKRTVAAIANEIHAENPGMATKDWLEQAASKTREVLDIKKKTAIKDRKVKEKPAFVKQGARPAPEEGLSGIAADINDLLEV